MPPHVPLRQARPARFAFAVLLAALAALGLATTTASAGRWHRAHSLGPKPARCGVGCWGSRDVLAVSWLADFTIAPLIVRPHQRVHAKVKPFVDFGEDGPLTGWSWPFRGCKPNAPRCTFRAGRPTNAWVRVAMGWSNTVGNAETDAVYAVVGKDDAELHGFVRDEAGDGVGGIRVRMRRRGSRNGVQTRTGGDGYFSAELKPGRYVVFPVRRPHHRDRFKPRTAAKRLRRGKTTRADFTLRDSLKVTLHADTTTVPADGLSRIALVAHVERDGRPLPGTVLSIASRDKLAEDASRTPGLICLDSGKRLWPGGKRLEAGNSLGEDATTDDRGDVHLTVIAGTRPGSFEVTAWARDGFGRLRTKNLQDVSDDVRLTFSAPGGGGSLAAMHDDLQTYAKQTTPKLSTSADQLAQQLAGFARDAGSRLGGLSFAPVQREGSGERSVIVTPAGAPPALSADSHLSSSSARVIPQGKLTASVKIAWGGFSNATSAGQLPAFPTLAEWQAGAKIGWDLTPGAATAGTSASSWSWYGWPYPGSGVCS